MSKCEGCRLKEPFASPDVRHLLTSKQRRVIKSRLRPEDWQLRSLAPTRHVQRGLREEKKKPAAISRRYPRGLFTANQPSELDR